MGPNKFDLPPLIITSNEDKSFDLHQTLAKYLYHWRLFAISLLLTLSGILTYLYFAQPTYEITATLLIKDRNNEGKSTLQEIEATHPPKLVENELEILKSRKLILQVVNDLHLWTRYRKKDGLKSEDLYNKSPIQLEVLELKEHLNGQKLEITISDNDKYILKTPDGNINEHLFKEKQDNNFGMWKLYASEDIASHKGETIIVSLSSPDSIAHYYQKAVEVKLLNKDAPAVGLFLTDEVPERGKDILNMLIENYHNAAISEKNLVIKKTIDFIEQRLASLSENLTSKEGELEAFRRERGLTEISSQSQIYLDNVQTNDYKLNEVNVQLNIIEGIENEIHSLDSFKGAPSALGISDPGLNKLIEQLSNLILQREQLLATTPEENPIFNPLNRQISSTQTAIQENIKSIKTVLLNTKNELESLNTKFEASIKEIPSQERELINIQRQQTIKEDLYIYLLQKKEDLSLNYAATLSDTQIIDDAYAGTAQEPNKLMLLTFALIFGMAVPVGYIYVKDSFNNRIITRKEIENAVKIPVLIELALTKSPEAIVVLNNDIQETSEQFRSLRTQLHFLHNRKTGRVTLLTSSISEEGKSFIASNLAVTLATSGRKTILIDLDLRKPKILESFRLSMNSMGLSNYLLGNVTLEEVIQSSGVNDKLDIIGAGTLPSNPSELLEQADIDAMLEILRTKYDDIIIDTPPVQLVTDALILSRLSDVTLYIIRQGHTFKSLLPIIGKSYGNEQLPKMNIIFNGIDKKRYGYGEEYGNGYYQEKGNKKRFLKTI